MRKRNYTVTIRMNKEEYNLLQSKVKESGRTQQEVVIKAIADLKIASTEEVEDVYKRQVLCLLTEQVIFIFAPCNDFPFFNLASVKVLSFFGNCQSALPAHLIGKLFHTFQIPVSYTHLSFPSDISTQHRLQPEKVHMVKRNYL